VFASALLHILINFPPYLHRDGEIDKPDRYNIVGSKRIDNLTLAKTIAVMLDKPLDYKLVDFHAARPGHDRHYGLDGSKLATLGWEPPITFEETLAATLKWAKEHPEWQ
jgi:dTDP-glucose 4,6-dehydratase